MKRFRGTLIALSILLVAVVVYIGVRQTEPAEEDFELPVIFQFEKEDLVGIKVARPDTTIELVRTDGEWSVVGDTWRPSSSMVRRVAHQLHDLTARATVVENPEDLSLYGLGEGAIVVSLTLKDGQELKFEAGDPNPSSVSWYIRRLPENTVYVVKKSALDYYRLRLEEFREHRFAMLNADEVDFIDATVDGRRLVLRRTAPKAWHLDEPRDWDAARSEVRSMTGRVGALKAFAFVEDAPKDLSKYELDPPLHKIRMEMSSGEVITLHVGSQLSDDPPQRYVYRVEDDAVYAARDGFLEPYQHPLEKYRKRKIINRYEWDLKTMRVVQGDKEVQVHRSPDGWRWPDDSPVPGSTPKRLASRAAEVEATVFHDTPPSEDVSGLGEPTTRIFLEFEDGDKRSVSLGNRFEIPIEVEEEPGKLITRSDKRVYVAVDGDEIVYEVHGGMADIVEDLFREYGRKQDRDQELSIREDGEATPIEPRQDVDHLRPDEPKK